MASRASPSLGRPEAPVHVAPAAETRAEFLRARLASGLAIAPLGVWTAMHLWHALSGFQGADAWQAALTEYPHPLAQGITAVVVLLPLAIHTAWGIGRLATSRPNNVRYPFYRNLRYALQRVTAVGVLLFLGAHMWLGFLKPRMTTGRPEPFADLAHWMHFHTPTLVTYVLGTLGVSYHLANGVQTFCMGWGVVSSRRAVARLEWLAVALFVVFLAMSWAAIYALWAAGAPARPGS
jgi:succinate dehydrogenase / fumarate reductase cytochrome b subunit